MTKKIIICDDDRDILEMLEIVLEESEVMVIPETDSKKVFSLISQTVPHLLLMDLWMPEISGDQILRNIRESDKFKSLPVIIMSAAKDGREIAMSAGANEYLAKPFDVDELLSKVHGFLDMN